MKATVARIVGYERVELAEEELVPKENEVLLHITACGICHGDLEILHREHPQPKRFGHEPMARIVEVGPWVKTFAVGDWVVGCLGGCFATHTLARETDLYRVPEALGERGCLAESLKCVTTVARAALPDLEDTVVVVGCGFMGLATLAMFARTWQGRLIAVDPVASRRAAALDLGATDALDPLACDVRQQVLDWTDGKGADAAVEFAGRPEAATLAARTLRRRGRLVLAAGNTIGSENSREIYMGAITVHHAPPMFSPDQGDDWARTLQAMVAGRLPLDKLVSHRFKLSEIQAALALALTGPKAGYQKGIVVNDIA